jgi:hypothetical protein
MDDELPGWEQQQDNERCRWDEEQALLRADPAWHEWLDQFELIQELEYERH